MQIRAFLSSSSMMMPPCPLNKRKYHRSLSNNFGPPLVDKVLGNICTAKDQAYATNVESERTTYRPACHIPHYLHSTRKPTSALNIHEQSGRV